MCIVAAAWKAHPKWKLIALGNRDELHARPSRPIARWDEAEHLLAGQDEKAGGTWLGVSEQGRFAVVTNVARSIPPDPNAASRGALLKDYLSGNGRFADLQATDFSQFNPFNLITVDSASATVHSNLTEQPSEDLGAGIFGLSNGTLENPWPKSARLNQGLENWLADDAGDFSSLLNLLRDESPTGRFGNFVSDLAPPPKPEYSPIFIKSPVYGTRCSSLVAIDHKGVGTFIERRFSPDGDITGETELNLSWP